MSNSGGRTRSPQSRSSCSIQPTRGPVLHTDTLLTTTCLAAEWGRSHPPRTEEGLRLAEAGGSNGIQLPLSARWAPRTVRSTWLVMSPLPTLRDVFLELTPLYENKTEAQRGHRGAQTHLSLWPPALRRHSGHW